jgi:hypothetical protein
MNQIFSEIDTKKPRLLIHDLEPFAAGSIFSSLPDDIELFAAKPVVAPCKGCFECWVKTPGICVIGDRGRYLSLRIASVTELIFVSESCYGGLSPSIKAVIDRIIPMLLPFFELVDGRMRHLRRYDNALALSYYFYTDREERPGGVALTDPALLEREKALQKRIAVGNATNFRATLNGVEYVGDRVDLMEVAF